MDGQQIIARDQVLIPNSAAVPDTPVMILGTTVPAPVPTIPPARAVSHR